MKKTCRLVTLLTSVIASIATCGQAFAACAQSDLTGLWILQVSRGGNEIIELLCPVWIPRTGEMRPILCDLADGTTNKGSVFFGYDFVPETSAGRFTITAECRIAFVLKTDRLFYVQTNRGDSTNTFGNTGIRGWMSLDKQSFRGSLYYRSGTSDETKFVVSAMKYQ